MDAQLLRAAVVSAGLILLLVLVAVANPRRGAAADADLPRTASAAPVNSEEGLVP